MTTTAVKTVTVTERGRAGNKRFVIFNLAISTYATAGCPFTPADLGLTAIEYMSPGIGLGGTLQPNTFTYDTSTSTVMLSWTYPAAQALATTDNTNAGTATGMFAIGY